MILHQPNKYHAKNMKISRLNVKILPYFSISEFIQIFSRYRIGLSNIFHLSMLIKIKNVFCQEGNYKNTFLVLVDPRTLKPILNCLTLPSSFSGILFCLCFYVKFILWNLHAYRFVCNVMTSFILLLQYSFFRIAFK